MVFRVTLSSWFFLLVMGSFSFVLLLIFFALWDRAQTNRLWMEVTHHNKLKTIAAKHTSNGASWQSYSQSRIAPTDEGAAMASYKSADNGAGVMMLVLLLYSMDINHNNL